MQYIDLRSDTVTQLHRLCAMQWQMQSWATTYSVMTRPCRSWKPMLQRGWVRKAALFVTSGMQGNACCAARTYPPRRLRGD